MSKDMSPKEESASPSSGSGSESTSSLAPTGSRTATWVEVLTSGDADDGLEEEAFRAPYSNGAGQADDLVERDDDDTLLAKVVVVAVLVLVELEANEDEVEGDSDDDLDRPPVETVSRKVADVGGSCCGDGWGCEPDRRGGLKPFWRVGRAPFFCKDVDMGKVLVRRMPKEGGRAADWLAVGSCCVTLWVEATMAAGTCV